MKEKPFSTNFTKKPDLGKEEVIKPNLKEENEFWRRKVKYPITTDFQISSKLKRKNFLNKSETFLSNKTSIWDFLTP
jgi:hypothetical protein